MRIRLLKNRLFMFFILKIAFTAHDVALALPNQEITVGLASGAYQKRTLSKTYIGASPFGFSGEYSIFVNQRLSLAGQFELNLEGEQNSAILIGGSGGLKFYAVGGDSGLISDYYIKGENWPKWNLFLLAGFANKSYDFTIPEKASQTVDEGLIVQKDAKDQQKGSVLGITMGFGITYPVVYYFQPGFRFNIFKSFSAEFQPDIIVSSIWISSGFVL